MTDETNQMSGVEAIDFYINKLGALIVKRPEGLAFSDFFNAYGHDPSGCSTSFNAACSMLEQVQKGIVSAMLDGDPDDEDATRMMEEFKKTVESVNQSHQQTIFAATDLVIQTFEVAKTNFLSGVRYAIAQRDGVLASLDPEFLNVYEATEEGVELEPASATKGNLH